MRWKTLNEERCPIARSLSVIGDRWTILVLRDVFRGMHTFEDLQAKLEIARPVLADRLRKLVAAGILEKRPYRTAPVRFEYWLTPRGLELDPVLKSLAGWGKDLPGSADASWPPAGSAVP